MSAEDYLPPCFDDFEEGEDGPPNDFYRGSFSHDHTKDRESFETRLIEIEEVVAVTPKAWGVKIRGVMHWIPKSKCRLVRAVEMPRWLIDRKGLG